MVEWRKLQLETFILFNSPISASLLSATHFNKQNNLWFLQQFFPGICFPLSLFIYSNNISFSDLFSLRFSTLMNVCTIVQCTVYTARLFIFQSSTDCDFVFEQFIYLFLKKKKHFLRSQYACIFRKWKMEFRVFWFNSILMQLIVFTQF